MDTKTTTLTFTKMHGLGNDFIIIDNRKHLVSDYAKLALTLCHRRFHIGADGIIMVEPSDAADMKMVIFNSDGSEAEMCGNGIRCFAKYLYDRKIVGKPSMAIETKAGIIRPQIVPIMSKSDHYLIRVDMGKPELRRSRIPMTGEETPTVIDEKVTTEHGTYTFTAVSMGNPHIAIFVDELPGAKLRDIGPAIEQHPMFPAKTNVEFVKVHNSEHVTVQVWERGAGETLACGTGACAVTVAGKLKKILGNRVTVTLPGGDLLIEWDGSGSVFMTGPAAEVFIGETWV